MSKKTLLLALALFGIFQVEMSGQKQLKKAEMLFEDCEYSKAAEGFQTYLSDNPNDYSAISKLAETYARMGQLPEADLWYKKIPSFAGTDPSTFKLHGDVLKKMGYYDEARKRYEDFRLFDPETADHLIKSCDFAKNALSVKPDYEAVLVPGNSNVSDFGLTFYKNMPVFSSFREDILMTESEREWNATNGSHRTCIYNAEKNRISFIKGINNKLNNLGPVSFSADGKRCALIEAKIRDSYSFILDTRLTNLSLGEVNDRGELTSSVPFMYNEVGSTINAVQLAFDGTALYFSSDRQGGFGGYDIYVSYLNNGLWSLPANLGPEINTTGNEVTPFLSGNKLYFASDYHTGLGGFDIVISEVVNGKWMQPVNPGNVFNTPGDEYFPAVNRQGDVFICSNRLGGKGGNDMYRITRVTPEVQEAEMLAEVVPPAVNLEELTEATQKNTVSDAAAIPVSLVETAGVERAFSLPEFDARKVGSNASEALSLEGAKRIGVGEIIPNTEVYFIQLASMSSSRPNFDKFKPLLKYGNIYKMLANRAVKVRLGYFTDRKEAEDVLSKVRTAGYRDAFIAYEILNTAQMELVLSGKDESSFSDKGNFNTRNPEVRDSYKNPKKYKVRLASYEDPIWFDVNKVKDLGRIEQWTKGGWTIFILAGYESLDEAKQAQLKAVNRGYKTAEVVIDNGGILERLRQN